MSDFFDKLSSLIVNNDSYKEASNSLFSSYILAMIGEHETLERDLVKKLISSAQILSKSSDTGYNKEGAVLLSMLLDTCANDYPDLLPIANNMFVSSGDFPNVKLLLERHKDFNFKYNFYSEAQMEFRESLNTVNELKFALTDYQRVLWDDLSSDKDVITSAPTSAGKTHIILNYILDKILKSDGSFAAVIVPTRALISEIAIKIYDMAKELERENEIEICTVPNKEGLFKDKTIFVMTQERLHELLLRGDISFDYLFIDEAQNITSSRGVLLHLTVEKLLEDSNPQIIISMPSSSYQDSFSTIFKDIKFEKEITLRSPVSKILISVVPKGKELVLSRHSTNEVKRISKGFIGTKFADIVYRLGKGQSNIIYGNKTNYCEDIANNIANLVEETKPNPQLEEAASYIEEFIHEEFTLASNLRKGVAFHYGPLPSSVRIMIENLAKDDQIQFIACTSTLAEGVNLPAKNLFLKNPAQPVMWESNKRLENVSILNITGRAGRMLQHFSGNVFLVEPDEWQFKDYFDDKTEEEEKIPTYFKSLNENLETIIKVLNGTYENDDKDQYTYYTIANKLIKEFANDSLKNTLDAKELTMEPLKKDELTRNIELAYDNLVVSTYTLEANPTVGYIQQNNLFRFLNEEENLSTWALPHPKKPDFYETLLRICNKLSEFGVYTHSREHTLEQICILTKKWVGGDALKAMITEQIQWEEEQLGASDKINQIVRKVLKLIDSDIRFRLSNALRCYQVLLNIIFLERGIEVTNVKLHSFIEVGAFEERMINLINIGLSREAAKSIHEALSKNEKLDSYNDLLQLYQKEKLNEVHPVILKEVKKLLS